MSARTSVSALILESGRGTCAGSGTQYLSTVPCKPHSWHTICSCQPQRSLGSLASLLRNLRCIRLTVCTAQLSEIPCSVR